MFWTQKLPSSGRQSLLLYTVLFQDSVVHDFLPLIFAPLRDGINTSRRMFFSARLQVGQQPNFEKEMKKKEEEEEKWTMQLQSLSI